MSDALIPRAWPERLAQLTPAHGMTPPSRGRDESPIKPLLDVVALLRRHWMLVVALGALGFGLSWYLQRNIRPVYRATATVRVADRSRALAGGIASGAADRARTAGTDPVQTQIQLLKSRNVTRQAARLSGRRLIVATPAAEEVVRILEVADSTPITRLRLDFLPTEVVVRGGPSPVRAAYNSTIELPGLRFAVTSRPSVAQAELVVRGLDATAEGILGALDGRPRERTDIIDVSYTSTSPLAAQEIVNAVVRSFQSLNASTAKQESARRRRFVEQQLVKTDGLLADAQLLYNNFRSREKVFSSQDKFKTQQADLNSIELRWQELDAERRIYASLYATLQTSGGGVSGDRLTAIMSSPGMASNPIVAQLFEQLVRYQGTRDSLTTGAYASAPNNPDVRRLDTLIAATERRMVGAVRGQLSAVEARVAALDAMRASAASNISGLPSTEGEESRLLSQLESYKNQSTQLRNELQKAEIEEAAEGGQVEIVDLAELPTVPIVAGRSQRLVLGTVLGALLATGIAYLLENRNTVIRRREDIERLVGAPNLALVPRFSLAAAPKTSLLRRAIFERGNTMPAPVQTSGSDLVTVSDAHSTGAEAYRTLRTNLLFTATHAVLRRLVVTSAGPQEGKSTTAANLAVTYAQQGRRTVLVDCDLRRPRIHKIFGGTQRSGVSDVLSGQMPLANVIRPTEIERLSVITSGPIPPNPSELLGSQKMQSMLDSLADSFDVVIVDTPPVLAASDAAILGRMVDGVVVIVRAGSTATGAVRETVNQLSTVGVRILGTVLNDPDSEVQRHAGYYGYYYNNYYSYSPSSS